MAKVNPSHKFILWEKVGQAETGMDKSSEIHNFCVWLGAGIEPLTPRTGSMLSHYSLGSLGKCSNLLYLLQPFFLKTGSHQAGLELLLFLSYPPK